MLSCQDSALFSPLNSPVSRADYSIDYFFMRLDSDINDFGSNGPLFDPYSSLKIFHERGHFIQQCCTTFGTFLSYAIAYRNRIIYNHFRDNSRNINIGKYGSSRRSLRSLRNSIDTSEASKNQILIPAVVDTWLLTLFAERFHLFVDKINYKDVDIYGQILWLPHFLQFKLQNKYTVESFDEDFQIEKAKTTSEFHIKNGDPLVSAFRGRPYCSTDLLEAWSACLDLIMLDRIDPILVAPRIETIMSSKYKYIFELYFNLIDQSLTPSQVRYQLANIAFALEASLNPPLPPLNDLRKSYRWSELHPPKRFSNIVRGMRRKKQLDQYHFKRLSCFSDGYNDFLTSCEVEVINLKQLHSVLPKNIPENYNELDWGWWYQKFQKQLLEEICGNKITSISDVITCSEGNLLGLGVAPVIIFNDGLARYNSQHLNNESAFQFIIDVLLHNSITDIVIGSGEISPNKYQFQNVNFDDIADMIANHHKNVFPYDYG